MFKRIAATLAVLFVVASFAVIPQASSASTRSQFLFGQQLPSNWLNSEQRGQRLYDGGFLFHAMAGSNLSWPGTYANLTVVPVTGLFVAVGPTGASSQGAVYQLGVDDSTAFGGFPSGVGTSALPADPTIIVLKGELTANTSNIGALSVGASGGQSVANLIECKDVPSTDITSQAINIVSTTGIVTATTGNRDRIDNVVCQFKASASAVSPTTPTVDSGFVAVGVAVVPFGTVTITTGMVSQTGALAPWAGFVDIQSAQTITGSKTFSSTIIASQNAAAAIAIGTSGRSFFTMTNLVGGPTFVGNGAAGFAGCAGINPDVIAVQVSGSSIGTCQDVNGNVGVTGKVNALGGFQALGATIMGSNATVTPSIPGGVSNGDIITQRSTSSGFFFAGGSAGFGIYGYDGTNLAITASGAGSLNIKQNGGVAFAPVNGGTYTNASDRRWKHDIHDVPYGLDIVMRLRPRAFAWNTNGQRDLGFVAQEVQPLLPEIVSTMDKQGHLGINYAGITPVLVRAIQQQEHEIRSLRNEVRELSPSSHTSFLGRLYWLVAGT
jgi:hypothetical protein